MAELSSPPGKKVWWYLKPKGTTLNLYCKRAMTAFLAARQCGIELNQVDVLGWTEEPPIIG